MGQVFPKQAPDENELRTREIDKTLKEDYRKSSQKISVLLLGLEDSDKTTVINQLKILNEGSFKDDLREQRLLIYKQIVKDIKTLLLNSSQFVSAPAYDQSIAKSILDIQDKKRILQNVKNYFQHHFGQIRKNYGIIKLFKVFIHIKTDFMLIIL